ncbi:MAG: cytochrome (ubi)quinol oxidase subunit III [Alicyclobacillus herbarius]|uniref:cytochrome (ubi)quinol oxidase subunit III n=1 Tax=Alicyclobacillus herbarius TaxID=122960 RepID=UPI00047DB579|nr:cytochrome (ubi)quinol oxidase subunit III [Alicyclobacillus herbarius]MCL6633990.1 cytochrome (ubi)quinol oxidase subunit III [Alicyclobacillus herbarius]
MEGSLYNLERRHPKHEHTEHADHPEPDLWIFGFWIFLSSDLIIFASLFAVYAVLHTHIANGPSARQIFDVTGFTAETLFLLTSSFTCGLATYSMQRGRKSWLAVWLVVTLILGLLFIGFEVDEFATDAMKGYTMSTSAFLSAFYTLVGTHGCHVSLGICWMTAILIQVLQRGITEVTARKVFVVGLYWHFLDVVWVFIFTVVYLTGVMS